MAKLVTRSITTLLALVFCFLFFLLLVTGCSDKDNPFPEFNSPETTYDLDNDVLKQQNFPTENDKNRIFADVLRFFTFLVHL